VASTLSVPPPSQPLPPVPTSALLPTPQPSPSIPFKKLSPEELALHREKGLCFNCDEKFSRGHCCSSKMFLSITDEDGNPALIPPDELGDTGEQVGPLSGQISLHTIASHIAPKTLCLVGWLAGHMVWILIDGGSTHNFIQKRLITNLGLTTQATQPLWVMVGSGHELECHLRCPDTLLRIQGHDFRVQFHVLPLCRADLVLVVEWLKSLGPVLTNYSELTMKFTHDGRIVELKGDHNNGVGSISVHQLRCLVQTNKVSEFFHL